jgi:hypothetical protein
LYAIVGNGQGEENAERSLGKWGLEINTLLLGDSLNKKMSGKDKNAHSH